MLNLRRKIKISMLAPIWLCFMLQPCFAEPLLVIANAENSSHEITKTDTINIFMGRYRQFANGQTAQPFDNLAYKNAFYEALVNKNAAEI